MKQKIGLIIYMAGMAAILAGCQSTQPQMTTPLTESQLGAFFSNARDPRNFGMTVYTSPAGPTFTFSNRTHPSQSTLVHFCSPGATGLPLIPLQSESRRAFTALVDTSARDSWITYKAAQQMEVTPLGPPAYPMKPPHVADDLLGYMCAGNTIIFNDAVYIETPLFYARAATGPLGPLARDAQDENPDIVLGCQLLKSFACVAFDYPQRRLALSSEKEIKPGDKLLATVPLVEVNGTYGIQCAVDGKELKAVLDSAGPFDLALPTPATNIAIQVTIGDLVLRQVPVVSTQGSVLRPETTARIGRNLLGRYRVTIDNQRRLVHFEGP